MGIPLFRKYFMSRVNRRKFIGPVDTMSIDANSILHDALATLQEKFGDKIFSNVIDEYFKLVTQKFEQYIIALKPGKKIFISIDGVAATAKMKQQRQRRFFGAATHQKQWFDRNILTPGTLFMVKLNEAIEEWVDQFQGELIVTHKAVAPVIMYSSHMVPGEGEHKIMDFLHNNKEKHNIIVGVDNDLIMLSLISKIPGIILTSEARGNRGVHVGEHVYELVDVDDVKLFVRELLAGKASAADPNEYVIDFVIVSMFLGNDFVPTTPAFEDMKNMDALYATYRSFVEKDQKFKIYNGGIVWENLHKYVEALAGEEFGLFVDTINRYKNLDDYVPYKFLVEFANSDADADFEIIRDKWYSKMIDSVDSLESAIETYSSTEYLKLAVFRNSISPGQIVNLPQHPETDTIYADEQYYVEVQGEAYGDRLKGISNFVIAMYGENTKDIIDARYLEHIKQFINSILWTLECYINGHSKVDKLWYYPFTFAPLITDVLDNWDKILPTVGFVDVDPEYLYPEEQLISVMPPESSFEVPIAIRKYINTDGELAPFFPTKALFIDDGKKVAHGYTLMLPIVPISSIKNSLEIVGSEIGSIYTARNVEKITSQRGLEEKAKILKRARPLRGRSYLGVIPAVDDPTGADDVIPFLVRPDINMRKYREDKRAEWMANT